MTEANMLKLYKHCVESGQADKAAEIKAIPRYSHFTMEAEEAKPEETSEEPEVEEPKEE